MCNINKAAFLCYATIYLIQNVKLESFQLMPDFGPICYCNSVLSALDGARNRPQGIHVQLRTGVASWLRAKKTFLKVEVTSWMVFFDCAQCMDYFNSIHIEHIRVLDKWRNKTDTSGVLVRDQFSFLTRWISIQSSLHWLHVLSELWS